jgi:hypothetical protein
MSIVLIEGFETMGPTSASSADVRARLTERYFVNPAGLGTVPVLLVPDQFGVHKALRIPSSFTSGVGLAMRLPDYMRVNTGGASSAAPAMLLHLRMKIPASLGANQSMIRFTTTDSGTTLLDLIIATNCQDISQTRQGTSRGSATGVLTPGGWNTIEWEFKPRTNANGGYGKVTVNGSLVINNTSDDFAFNPNDRPAWGFRFPGIFASAGVADFEWDDIYVLDLETSPNNSSLGNVRVIPAFPSADTAQKDWTPDTGSVNFSRVNDPYAGGSVETDVDGNVDRYTLQDAPSGVAIYGVKVEARAINTTSGTPNLHFGLHNTTTSEATAVISNTATTDVFPAIFNEKPGGGTWTESDFNSTEASIRFEA